MFFTADDGIHGKELWKSDGTRAGTVLVKDIDPGRPGYYYYPRSLTAVGGTLFFTVGDGTHARELWKSDGTKAGTVLVKDIDPNNERYGGPEDLTAVDGRLFFTSRDGIHGKELWKSDGSRAGTVLVKDITPGTYSNYYDYSPHSLTAVGGTLFFVGQDGTHGQELWKSDGSRAGTVMVKDIFPGPFGSGYYGPSSLTDVGGTLFFTATDGTSSDELWKSNGTRAGTVMVKNINPGDYGSSYPVYLTDVGGRLFFAANDGTRGRELWRSDGTKAGTVLVRNIRPGGDGYSAYSSYPGSLTAVSGRLFFTADDGTHGTELWKSNGSRAGTVLVKNIDPDDEAYGGPSPLTAVGGTLLFAADDGTHGRELWKSDGSRAGTLLVKDIHACATGASGSYPYSSMTAVGGRLFFAADDGIHGQELWKSNGSKAGTVLVKDINIGTTR